MEDDSYQYGGAKTLVALHEQSLREFLDVWREADRQGIVLPETSNPNYASRATLLAHVLGCAGRYLVWICEQLALPEPEVEQWPDPEDLAPRAQAHMERVLEAWREPLRGLTEDRAYEPAHPSRWGPAYCIDAMMEHAVLHPIRHTHQLRQLLSEASRGGAG